MADAGVGVYHSTRRALKRVLTDTTHGTLSSSNPLAGGVPLPTVCLCWPTVGRGVVAHTPRRRKVLARKKPVKSRPGTGTDAGESGAAIMIIQDDQNDQNDEPNQAAMEK